MDARAPQDVGPSGPRGRLGRQAEEAAARYLRQLGWRILERNRRVGRDEIDILARDGQRPTCYVVVEVRSRSRPRSVPPLLAIDRGKVVRLYRAARALQREALTDPRSPAAGSRWRVDLVVLERGLDGTWQVTAHLRGLEPP